MIAKTYQKGREKLLAACDEDVLGKELEEGELYLKVSENFYGKKEITSQELEELMDECTIGNLVGKRVVALAVEKELVEKEKILRIGNIPHAQFARIIKKVEK